MPHGSFLLRPPSHPHWHARCHSALYDYGHPVRNTWQILHKYLPRYHYTPRQSPCPQSAGHRPCFDMVSYRSALHSCRFRHSNPWQVSTVHHSHHALSACPILRCHRSIAGRQRTHNRLSLSFRKVPSDFCIEQKPPESFGQGLWCGHREG